MYSADAQQYLSYTLGVADIHLRSGTTLPAPKLPLITKIPDPPTTLEPLVVEAIDPTNVTMSTQAQLAMEPPFP